MEVRGEIHATVALTPGKEPQYPLNGRITPGKEDQWEPAPAWKRWRGKKYNV